MLWEHDRPLPPYPPVLDGGVLWLAEDDRVTVVGGGVSTQVRRLPRGVPGAGASVPGGALFPRAGGNLVLVDRTGEITGRVRAPAPVDRLVGGAGAGPLAYAVGKGHLTALFVQPGPGWSPAGHLAVTPLDQEGSLGFCMATMTSRRAA